MGSPAGAHPAWVYAETGQEWDLQRRGPEADAGGESYHVQLKALVKADSHAKEGRVDLDT